MSILITYQGCLDNFDEKSKILDEIRDICRSMQWQWENISGDFEGVSIHIEKYCQSIPFVFDSHGCLSAHNSPEIRLDTQSTSADIHMTLIELLLYLGKKYFKHFQLYDDTGYADSKNADKVQLFFDYAHYNLSQIRKLLAQHADVQLKKQSDYLVSHKIERMLQKRLQNVLLHRIEIKSGLY